MMGNTNSVDVKEQYFHACKTGTLEQVTELIERKGLDVNYKDKVNIWVYLGVFLCILCVLST